MILDLVIKVRNNEVTSQVVGLPESKVLLNSSGTHYKIQNPEDPVRLMLDAFIAEEHQTSPTQKTEYVRHSSKHWHL